MTTGTEKTPDAQDNRDRSGFSADDVSPSLARTLHDYRDRIKGGDMGSLPAILGLVVLFVFFSAYAGSDFYGKQNIANLFVQAAPICILAMGLVPVLLLGDIDLAAGVTGGTSATFMALLTYKHDQPWWIAIIVGILVGMFIGVLIGTLVSRLGIPSFVVTLAFFLGLQGVILKVIGDGGTFAVKGAFLEGITGNFMPIWLGWTSSVLVVALYAGIHLRRYQRAVRDGLQHPPLALIGIRTGALAVVLLLITALLSSNRSYTIVPVKGIPWTVPLIGVLLILWTVVFGRTAYGRHVYAVGGNREAARRAGIDVLGIRTSVFVITGGMAAISGIVSASFTGSVTPSSGGGNTLLYAVGAAVIGGTSLFGGRGKVLDAVVGGFVIALIDNGLPLITEKSYVNFIVTGVVLLLAASVDAITRRRRVTTGT